MQIKQKKVRFNPPNQHAWEKNDELLWFHLFIRFWSP